MKKLFIIIALITTIAPAIFVIREAGGLQNWKGVLPRGTTDSLYYYARIHEVADGHPLIGNPYAYEHRDALSPAFFLPDIVSSIPILLGLPFDIAVLANVFIWSFIFLFLSFILLRFLRMPVWWSAIWATLAYISSYSFMLRPTVMQIVYSAFLLFLIALARFLHEPLVRRRALWLAIVAASSFYIYSYLSYIVFITFGFLFFWFLTTRRFKEFRALITAGICTAFLLIPFGIYTLMQMSGPHYFEMFSRIGLVYTHIPAIEAYYYGRWVVLGLAVLGLLWYFSPKKEEGILGQNVFWFATGTGLFVSLLLNVITGVELTLAVHIGRFVIPWMMLALGATIYALYDSKYLLKNAKIPYLIAGFLLLILIGGGARNFIRGLDFFGFNDRGDKISNVQSYAAPLKWLDEQVPEQSVIWANDSISSYIPVMTKHYVLFHLGAGLHSISDDELIERYLLARSAGALTIEDLKRDFGLYVGAGASKLQPLAQNQRAWVCNTIARFSEVNDCPKYTDGIALRGEEYFKILYQRFLAIKKDRTKLLQKFNVKYMLVDRANDKTEGIIFNKPLYDDGRFIILQI